MNDEAMLIRLNEILENKQLSFSERHSMREAIKRFQAPAHDGEVVAARKVSDAEAIAWAERNDFQGSFVDLRAAIEDAQSIGTPHTAPPRVVDLQELVAEWEAKAAKIGDYTQERTAASSAIRDCADQLQAALENP